VSVRKELSQQIYGTSSFHTSYIWYCSNLKMAMKCSYMPLVLLNKQKNSYLFTVQWQSVIKYFSYLSVLCPALRPTKLALPAHVQISLPYFTTGLINISYNFSPIGFEILTEVLMQVCIFWDIKPCSTLEFIQNTKLYSVREMSQWTINSDVSCALI
jgi:hypothetical protein